LPTIEGRADLVQSRSQRIDRLCHPNDLSEELVVQGGEFFALRADETFDSL
jgi:hypothetical protein